MTSTAMRTAAIGATHASSSSSLLMDLLVIIISRLLRILTRTLTPGRRVRLPLSLRRAPLTLSFMEGLRC